MGELREIVSIESVDQLFLALAILCPILGAGIGAFLGSRKQHILSCENEISQNPKSKILNPNTLHPTPYTLKKGFLVGCFGTLNWILWKVFNFLTNMNGLDTVKNLVINLILFVILGIALGVGVGGLARKKLSVKED